MSLIRRCVGGVAILVLLSGCGAYGSGGGTAGSSTATLDAYNYYFNPAAVNVSSTGEMTITLTNRGSTTHNLTIDGTSVNQDIEVGKSVTVKWTPGKTGTFNFHCEYHQKSGMVGTINVGSGGAAPSDSTPAPQPTYAGGYHY
jgi:plastocyanin